MKGLDMATRCRIATQIPWMVHALFSGNIAEGHLYAREEWLNRHVCFTDTRITELFTLKFSASAYIHLISRNRSDSSKGCATCERVLQEMISQELRVSGCNDMGV